MKKRVIVTHFTKKIVVLTCTLPLLRKFYLPKNILAYCGYSPTSPLFLLLFEHEHWDNAATNSNSKKARSRMVASLRGSVGTGQRKMSQVLGVFGLLDFTMLRPVLASLAFWNLWTVYFLSFPIFFSGRCELPIRRCAYIKKEIK